MYINECNTKINLIVKMNSKEATRNCPVCERFLPHANGIVILTCGHIYHSACHEVWQKIDRNCLACKADRSEFQPLLVRGYQFVAAILSSIVTDHRLDPITEDNLTECLITCFLNMDQVLAESRRLESFAGDFGSEEKDPHPYALIDASLRSRGRIPPYGPGLVYRESKALNVTLDQEFVPPRCYHLAIITKPLNTDKLSSDVKPASSGRAPDVIDGPTPVTLEELDNEHPLSLAWFLVHGSFAGTVEPSSCALTEAKNALRGKYVRPLFPMQRRYLCYRCRCAHYASYDECNNHRFTCKNNK